MIKRPDEISIEAKWLKGEGAGAWLLIEDEKQSQKEFRIKRFSEYGIQEFDLLFEIEGGELNLQKPYSFDYPSHASKCTILQGGSMFTLKRIPGET